MTYPVKSAINILWQKMFHLIEHDIPQARPTLGDYINTIESQKRLEYILFYNPNLVRIEYQSALNNTRENVLEQHEKKGLTRSMFRNFARRDKDQALKILQIINNNIYGPLFEKLGKGYGSVLEVDPNSKHVIYQVESCNECSGLPNMGIHSCFYFAGILAGIYSAIFQQSMGVFESECVTRGNSTCKFEVGLIRDMNFRGKVDRYLKIELKDKVLKEVEPILSDKILALLKDDNPIKPQVGTNIHIFGYQMRILNFLEQNPEIFLETHRKAGNRFSNHLSDILSTFYETEGEELLTVALPSYYEKHQIVKIDSIKKENDGLIISFSESIECAGIKELDVRPCAFLQGEIEGIATIATGKPVRCEIHSCRYETEKDFCQFKLSYLKQEEEVPDWLKEMYE